MTWITINSMNKPKSIQPKRSFIFRFQIMQNHLNGKTQRCLFIQSSKVVFRRETHSSARGMQWQTNERDRYQVRQWWNACAQSHAFELSRWCTFLIRIYYQNAVPHWQAHWNGWKGSPHAQHAVVQVNRHFGVGVLVFARYWLFFRTTVAERSLIAECLASDSCHVHMKYCTVLVLTSALTDRIEYCGERLLTKCYQNILNEGEKFHKFVLSFLIK